MPELIQLGSFMIQMKLLILIVSIVLAYYVLRWKLTGLDVKDDDIRNMLDKLVNAVLIAVVVWKLSPIAQDPAMIWTRPLGLLTYTGGSLGIWLGLAAGLLYLSIALIRKRHTLSAALTMDVTAFGLLVAWTVYRLVFWEYGTLTNVPWGISLNDPYYRYHPVNVYAGIIAVVLAVYVWLMRNGRWGTGFVARDILAGLGLGWFAVTFFKTGDIVFLLTAEQWLMLVLAACGMAMPYIGSLIQSPAAEHNKDGKEMIDVVKETSMNSSMEQRKQAQENRREEREYKTAQPNDKKLDGPNRPAE